MGFFPLFWFVILFFPSREFVGLLKTEQLWTNFPSSFQFNESLLWYLRCLRFPLRRSSSFCFRFWNDIGQLLILDIVQFWCFCSRWRRILGNIIEIFAENICIVILPNFGMRWSLKSIGMFNLSKWKLLKAGVSQFRRNIFPGPSSLSLHSIWWFFIDRTSFGRKIEFPLVAIWFDVRF